MTEATEAAIHNGHDHFFKSWFGDVRALRQFLQHRLPSNMLQHIDISQLAREESVLTHQLGSKYADMVYSTVFRESGERVYLLLEHKSQPDDQLPWQVCRYMCLILDMHKQRYPDESEFPVVLPVLIYHDAQHKDCQRVFNVFELFDDPSQEMRSSISVGIRMIDCNAIADEVYLQEGWASLGAYVYKHIGCEDIVARLGAVGTKLKAAEKAGHDLGIRVMIN